MNLSQGFPLYDNITEVLPNYSQKKTSDMIKEALMQQKLIPEPGDMILKAVNELGETATIIIDKDRCDSIVSEINKTMIKDIIESNHIPTILEYLTLSGETVNAEKYDTGIMSKIVEYKVLRSTWIPKEIKDYLMNKTTNPNEEKDYMILITFPEGIKDSKLFIALTPFINNIVSNKENNNPQKGYIEIMVYPCGDYDRINHLVSRIFEAI